MPTYIIQKVVREYHTLRNSKFNYVFPSKWRLDMAWPKSEPPTRLDPWHWNQALCDDCDKAWGAVEEGWSVYIDLEEANTLLALELGMEKINEAMGLRPEVKKQNKVRNIKCLQTTPSTAPNSTNPLAG